MKQYLKHISAFALAILVLFSTFSFTVSEHFCGGYAISHAIGIPAKTCGMEMQKDIDNTTTVKSSCCNDIVNMVEGQNELQLDFDSLEIAQQQFILSFTYSYFQLFETLENHHIPFKAYVPPLIVRDIQVLDETFLI